MLQVTHTKKKSLKFHTCRQPFPLHPPCPRPTLALALSRSLFQQETTQQRNRNYPVGVSRSRSLRAECEGELRFARQIISHEALTLHLGDAEALVHLGEDNLHHELVTWDDGAAELDAVDAGEEKLLLGAAM